MNIEKLQVGLLISALCIVAMVLAVGKKLEGGGVREAVFGLAAGIVLSTSIIVLNSRK